MRQNEAPQALQVVRADEVGQLVGGFNRLLDTLNQQQRALQQSELFKQAVLNSVTAEIAVLNHAGIILPAHEAWQRGVAGQASGIGPAAGLGANDLGLCDEASVCEGIQAVLSGEMLHFILMPNRRLVEDRLTHELLRARPLQHRLAPLFIDLDQFKPINDSLGHAVGDNLLQMVAQRIQGCLRESDTAARLGGDEFVVLLPELQSQEDAQGVAEKIRHELARELVTVRGLSLSLTISSSIGVALFPDHGHTEKDLMRLGDEAVYQAKKAGRNAVVMCKPQSTGA